jgi:diacylglycerol kinase family enzyme
MLVISAGTRNHFALDLGLDREDPSRCLDALTDGVELRVDLGQIGGRPFVNNASFGAYAAVVQSPSYRADKAHTTLDLLPDLIAGHRGARLRARAGNVTVDGPQAVLVSNNTVGITVGSAMQAAGLLRGRQSRGLAMLSAGEIVVEADAPSIPVGVDGEALSLPTPVRCNLRPKVLRVRVPRNRPGVPLPKPPMNWRRLRQMAL